MAGKNDTRGLSAPVNEMNGTVKQSVPISPALVPARLGREQLSQYEYDFNVVFANPDIRNIALSGPYGAGKSSVMKSWCQLNRNHKAIFVSLAHFSNGENEKLGENGTSRRELEWRLINQLSHKCDLSKAPRSRFRHTRDVPKYALRFFAAIVLLVTSCALCLSQWESLGLDDGIRPLFGWTLVAVLALATAYVLTNVVEFDLVRRLLRKFKFMNFEAELDDGNEDTIFDKHLDDILYLLGSMKEDVVVFEDLDRYDILAPLEELREINDLVNHIRMGERGVGTPLRFFYLVRDGLFRNPYERTKFFDYIIPVVPYVDPDNSKALLATRLHEFGIFPSDDLLFALAHYIDDPRILIDIVAEARHHKAVLFGDRAELCGDDADKLVAVLAYKAFFPGDYELLQRGRGYVWAVLNYRDRLREEATTACQAQLDAIEEERREVRLTVQEQEDEVALAYFGMHPNASVHFDYPISNRIARAQSPKEYLRVVYSNDGTKAQWRAYVDQNLSGNASYREQIKRVGEAGRKRLSELAVEEKRVRRTSQSFASMRFAELAEHAKLVGSLASLTSEKLADGARCNKDEVDTVILSRHHPMLELLIVRGWIDESYPRYLSTFREGDLALEDREVLKDIRAGKRIDRLRTVREPMTLLRHLGVGELVRPNSWNYDIAKGVFEGTNEELSQALLGALDCREGRSFIVDYCLSDRFTENGLDLLLAASPNLLGTILGEAPRDDARLRRFCHLLLAYAGGRNWGGRPCPYGDAAKDFASKDKLFLSLLDDEGISISALVSGLSVVGYEMEDVDAEGSDVELLRELCERGMLRQNATLVDAVLGRAYDLPSTLEEGCLLDGVLASGSAGIMGAAESDPDRLLASMRDNGPEKYRDSSEALVWIANCYEGRDDLGLLDTYFSKVTSRVERLDDVADDRCKDLVFSNEVMENTGPNLMCYYRIMGDESLDDFAAQLNREGVPSDLTASCVEQKGVDTMDFVLRLAGSKELEDGTFEGLVETLGIHMDVLDPVAAKGLGEHRLGLLCRAKGLAYTSDNLRALVGGWPSAVDGYAAGNPTGFVSALEGDTSYLYEDCVVRQLINCDLPEDVRRRMLSLYGVVRLRTDYDDPLLVDIVTNDHLDDDDMPRLFEMYGDAGDELREAIEGYVFGLDVGAFRRAGVPVPSDLSKRILENSVAGGSDFAKAYIAIQLSYIAPGDAKSLEDEIADLLECGQLKRYSSFVREAKPSRIYPGEADKPLYEELRRLRICSVRKTEKGKTLILRVKGGGVVAN